MYVYNIHIFLYTSWMFLVYYFYVIQKIHFYASLASYFFKNIVFTIHHIYFIEKIQLFFPLIY